MAMKTMAGALLATGALLVAACGGSAQPAKQATKPAASQSGGLKVTTSGKGFLTDGSGRALYLWVADTGSKSVCSGECADDWPPLTTQGTPAAGGGVKAGDLGTTARSGGAKQVTYDGHPLYYYEGDTGPGTTTGQGSPQFGAKWWLVAPSGKAITTGG
jgi:predicted lipoprotein with Yx(FWY)xxD motif